MFASEDEEDNVYQEDVNVVKSWWTGSRWRYIRRPYTAEEIVAKRGNLKIEYPSNVQAKKLWRILEERFAVFCPEKRLIELTLMATESRRKFHLWMLGAYDAHADGQVPRYSLRLWLAKLFHRILYR